MKLLKYELNRYHRSVQECIRQRKEWITYYSIRLRWKKMKKEVDTFMIWNNPIMSFFLNIIYLPIKLLKIYENIKIKHDLKETEKEIEVLEKELVYIDNLRWGFKNENNSGNLSLDNSTIKGAVLNYSNNFQLNNSTNIIGSVVSKYLVIINSGSSITKGDLPSFYGQNIGLSPSVVPGSYLEY